MGRNKHAKNTFRNGSYYAHVWIGKRTIKEGEAAAVWNPQGVRTVIEGPHRKRLFFSHIRFLDRYVADQSQYLIVQYRNGKKVHLKGPVALFFDPCCHENVEVRDCYHLTANEALVVYLEERNAGECVTLESVQLKSVEDAMLMKDARTANGDSSSRALQGGPLVDSPAHVLERGRVNRRVVRGPAVFSPNANEWVHSFSWHGSIQQGKGSKTGAPNDEKAPHALRFEKVRTQPDQMYYSVRDVRTVDDAQITIHLMLFYELTDIVKMIDATNDPIGDFINAASADVLAFGAGNTYESLLKRTTQLSELETFPILSQRMQQIGYELLNVVYRGYSTSPQLQAMHDEAIAERTKLKLKADTGHMEQAQHAMELRCKQERSQQELEMGEAELRHRLAMLDLEAEQQRRARDADLEQELRHAEARFDREQQHQQVAHDQELRRYTALKGLGVDLTKYMCVLGASQPHQHVRVDSSSDAPTQLLFQVPRN